MAILLIKIEDTASLALNEFFDYNGRCYAVAGVRGEQNKRGFRMEEFYEATRDTERLENVPVFFVTGEGSEAVILGWYKRAVITRQIRTVSLFLEGNVEVASADAVLLPEQDRITKTEWQNPGQLYEVVEQEDMRYEALERLLKKDPKENSFLRYSYAPARLEPKLLKNPDACLQYCGTLAQVLLNDQCRDISEIKLLEKYAEKMKEKRRDDPDGWYYHALACCHLGFFREGIKSIQKALELEPEAADLKALKGMLLAERGYYAESAACLREAYEKNLEEDYLLLEGRVHSMAGQMNRAYECFAAVKDQTLLDSAGIHLQEMEKRWSFADLLSFRRKNRTRGKKR
ncbi:MAG: hypothetical protein Q4B03_01510 [Lachnospiraceae bacterium]|nr:hypothetical protein [Lachnospiraceae bacterium]